MNRLINFITKLIVKFNKKYSGWCGFGYTLYRHLGYSLIKAYRGAFILELLPNNE